MFLQCVLIMLDNGLLSTFFCLELRSAYNIIGNKDPIFLSIQILQYIQTFLIFTDFLIIYLFKSRNAMYLRDFSTTHNLKFNRAFRRAILSPIFCKSIINFVKKYININCIHILCFSNL